MKYEELYKKVMESPSVHFWTKEIIREGLNKDCVDAVYDVELALKVLRARMNGILEEDLKSV